MDGQWWRLHDRNERGAISHIRTRADAVALLRGITLKEGETTVINCHYKYCETHTIATHVYKMVLSAAATFHTCRREKIPMASASRTGTHL